MAALIVPVIGTGIRLDPFRPKYMDGIIGWTSIPFDDKAVVMAELTQQQITDIGANSDAIVIENIDATVALNATRNALEAMNLPGNWVQSGMTYREVLRVVCGIHLLLQRAEGMGVKITIAGNLDLTMAQVPANIRQALADAADSLGLDRSGVTLSTTVREVLRSLAAQFQNIQLGVVL